MSQRNISALVAIILLFVATLWIATSELNYTIPQTAESGIGETAPWWANFVGWQGDETRSIRTHYGLDLVGGTQVVLEAEQTGDTTTDYSEVMEAARVVIENRVSGGLGVVEPRVQLEGDSRIIVELPEVKDPDQAISLVKETGTLEFVEALQFPLLDGDVVMTTRQMQNMDPTQLDGTESLTSGLTYPDQVFQTIMTGAQLEDARVEIDGQTGGRVIGFTLTDDGRDTFSDYTRQHVGDFVAIVLDGVVISNPRIESHISDKNGIISSGSPAGFDPQEADDLAIKLKYGALPVPLKVVENRTVGPTLGQESLQRSLRAGMIGLVVVFVFMLIYYRVPGLVASLALILYGLMNLSVYKLLPVTLTVPAITGFILTIGMAVDANILVFERMKEELRAGRGINRAIEAGFSRAWPSIRDGNLSTLITAMILFWFGSNFGASIVRGFAITLAIGVLINLFTAVTVTRVFMRFVVAVFGKSMENNSRLLLGLNLNRNEAPLPTWVKNLFRIVDKRRFYYILSLFIIIPSLVLMGVSMVQYGTPLKLAIDYTGGSIWEMAFEQPVGPVEVREIFTDAGYNNTIAQSVAGDNIVLIRTTDLTVEEKGALSEIIQNQLGNYEERRFEAIGPTIGREVTRASGVAVAVASLAILLFIWYAFRTVGNAVRYGVSAIAAMLHDVIITAGIYALMGLLLGWEVDTLFLTAILTVIGYSVNDTIVVFDRIRENLPRRRSEPFDVVADRSLLETLQRSLATSISTLFVVGSILFFGGATTQKFMAVMFVGIVSGTYSSIFTAVPLLVSWHKGDFRRLIGRGDSQSMEEVTAS